VIRGFNRVSYYLRLGLAIPIGLLGVLLLGLTGLISGRGEAYLTVTLRGEEGTRR